MTFPRNKKEINVEKLSEVINDNETGKRFYEASNKVISINKETPERIIPMYVEDEWDNIHGDMIHFK